MTWSIPIAGHASFPVPSDVDPSEKRGPKEGPSLSPPIERLCPSLNEAGGRATSPASFCEQPADQTLTLHIDNKTVLCYLRNLGGNTVPASSDNSFTDLGVALEARPELVEHPIVGKHGSRSPVPPTLAEDGVVPEQLSIRIVNIGI